MLRILNHPMRYLCIGMFRKMYILNILNEIYMITVNHKFYHGKQDTEKEQKRKRQTENGNFKFQIDFQIWVRSHFGSRLPLEKNQDFCLQ